MKTNNDALNELYGNSPQPTDGEQLAIDFMAQMDAYYSLPSSSFYDNKIERKFLEQKLRHIGFKPYPDDGLGNVS